ncbi:DUF2442 domain-containing protein [Mongoliibacter ruber]|uniref:Uncharacterized protein DUF2442 n=1 Tax=Mongoliibacter ruber TaxID=1750599 RepID=A0A2T0WTG4_9BACT|nr:DUF2442 domain-containing protein [Mongoliibacter ruber]PRY89985.1 uncharacterized protein DUF2442 [Mongoliibacter ruber]
MNISTIHKSPLAKKVWFDQTKFYVLLDDEREIGIPLEWFKKLKLASFEELSQYRLIGNGEGIHWEALDEDILVEALL